MNEDSLVLFCCRWGMVSCLVAIVIKVVAG